MIELNVPFVEKDEVKRLGARWNNNSKRWYVPNGIALEAFARWLPDDFVADAYSPASDQVVGDRVQFSLSAFLFKVGDVIQKNFTNAVWISAEISELQTKGHMYITLVEHNEQGTLIAKTRATIWQRQAELINDKFLKGTGSKLEANIKVLMLARVEFHPQYGMSLFIEDIDPTYTLGDMAAKLAKIRETLINEKIINNNKQLAKPSDFTRVAVISPQQAAGLGDFNREANILIKHNLCEFIYFTAVFQGEQAPTEICQALDAAIAAHQKQAFDAIVIIRGGGALSDLAWLNNEQLARAVCLCPVHVMVGIGHERDYTILDEVAGERFDTPSKVVQRIFNLITGNATEAENNYLEISRKVQQYYKYARYTLEKLQQDIGLFARQAIVLAQRNIDERYNITAITAKNLLQRVTETLQSLMSEILSQSPRKILEKGFAMLSNPAGKLITSKQAASQEATLNIEFYDGSIKARITND